MKKFMETLKIKNDENVNFLNTCAIIFCVIGLVFIISIVALAEVFSFYSDVYAIIALAITGIALVCGIFCGVYDAYLTRQYQIESFPDLLNGYIHQYEHNDVAISWNTSNDIRKFLTDEIARLKASRKSISNKREREDIDCHIYDAKLVMKRLCYCEK